MFPRIYSYAIIYLMGTVILRSCLAKEEEIKKRISDKPKRTVSIPPSYAVPMEPLRQYSQRDPLYHKRFQPSDSVEKERLNPLDTSRSDEDIHPKRTVARDGYEIGSYYPPPYYTQPEPIIEIIIKESNATLPTTVPPPPRPTTKEPIHVFYVKYKKNPNPKGKDDRIIYDPPIPAIMPHTGDISSIGEDKHRGLPQPIQAYHKPPSTTTLRTIIRPESETYHGSGIKVTFGNPEETEAEEGTEQRPRVVLPPDSLHPGQAVLSPFHPESHSNRHSYLRPLPHGVGVPPPTQIFNSQPRGHLVSPDGGLIQENHFQGNKFTPPSDEEIRRYQEEKLFLYRQSLKQLNTAPPQPISPIIPPQRFQQPTSNPPSQLQIDFNNQKQLIGIQHRDVLPNQDHKLKQPDHNFQRTEPPHYQQKPQYFSTFNPEQDNINHGNYQRGQSLIPYTNGIRENHTDSTRNLGAINYDQNLPNQFYSSDKRPPSIPGLKDIKDGSIQQGINVFEQTIVSHESQENPCNTRQSASSACRHFGREPEHKLSVADGEIQKSVAQSEEHLVTPDYRHEFYSSLREPPKRNKLPNSNDQLQFYPVYSTSPPATSKHFLPRISTAIHHPPPTSSPYTVPTTIKPNIYHSQTTRKNEETSETPFLIPENKTAIKNNLAALPNEVPEDLRAQLLSSGILNNADIQILDYDKIGDIPIENLPPEHLEHFQGAGSDPVPSVVKPESDRTEMKAKLYNPHTEKGQKGIRSHFKKHLSQLETSKYNRYLPLKVNGTNFTLPDPSQLKGGIVKSVVVLAPVYYDFVGMNQEGEERVGKAIQVEGIRFIAGEALRDLVKEPTRENYSKWLAQEKSTPSRYQSVVLLITRKDERGSKNSPEIFMYDLNSETISKLRGELSQTFVEVAESNSSNRDLDGIDTSN